MDGSQISRRVKATLLRGAAGSAVLVAATIGAVGGIATGGGSAAWAAAAPYELYCPKTPVGDIALNNVTTTGTITPANPAVGSTFQITGYQATVTIPAAIVTAAAALGNPSIQGSATAKIDMTGATPATMSSPTLSFNQTIPTPVPSSGLNLTLPSTPANLGPFTATSSNIVATVDKATSLSLVVTGNTLTLTCTAYANNTIANSGIVQAPGLPASAQAISPPLASTTAGATTATTAPPTSPSSSLAQTGAGPGVWLLGELGLGTLALAAVLLLGDRARRALALSRHGSSGVGRKGGD